MARHALWAWLLVLVAVHGAELSPASPSTLSTTDATRAPSSAPKATATATATATSIPEFNVTDSISALTGTRDPADNPDAPVAAGGSSGPTERLGKSPPANCTTWFDGCNNCTVSDGQLLACTARQCGNEEAPRCVQYESEGDPSEGAAVEDPRDGLAWGSARAVGQCKCYCCAGLGCRPKLVGDLPTPGTCGPMACGRRFPHLCPVDGAGAVQASYSDAHSSFEVWGSGTPAAADVLGAKAGLGLQMPAFSPTWLPPLGPSRWPRGCSRCNRAHAAWYRSCLATCGPVGGLRAICRPLCREEVRLRRLECVQRCATAPAGGI